MFGILVFARAVLAFRAVLVEAPAGLARVPTAGVFAGAVPRVGAGAVALAAVALLPVRLAALGRVAFPVGVLHLGLLLTLPVLVALLPRGVLVLGARVRRVRRGGGGVGRGGGGVAPVGGGRLRRALVLARVQRVAARPSRVFRQVFLLFVQVQAAHAGQDAGVPYVCPQVVRIILF